jgi:hypothetical protein
MNNGRALPYQEKKPKGSFVLIINLSVNASHESMQKNLPYLTPWMLILLSAESVCSQQKLHNERVPVIEPDGNAFHRGCQHGRILKEKIAAVYKKWKRDMEENMKQDADSVMTRFYHATDFVPAIKKWPPGL